ncbi:K02A2.6-like, partial [Cordylochernes scorpioides]
MPGIGVSWPRTTVMDYTIPFIIDIIYYVTRAPSTKPKSLAIIYPFTPQVDWSTLSRHVLQCVSTGVADLRADSGVVHGPLLRHVPLRRRGDGPGHPQGQQAGWGDDHLTRRGALVSGGSRAAPRNAIDEDRVSRRPAAPAGVLASAGRRVDAADGGGVGQLLRCPHRLPHLPGHGGPAGLDRPAPRTAGLGPLHRRDPQGNLLRRQPKDTIRMENAEAGTRGINPRRERIIEPCKWCGQRHKYGKCPAYGKKCNACGKTNHFSVACRTKRIRNLLAESEAEESCDEINLNEVAVKTVRSDKWSAVIIINGKKTTVHLDTGAQINVLPHKVINQWSSRPEIRPTSLKAFAYGNTELPIVGKCNVLCQYGEKKGMFEFIVADVEAQTLITGDTCEKLEILRRINHINTDEMKLCSETQKILEQYHEVFQGVGLINSECKIYTKPEYSPVQVPPRRIPTSLGAEVQSELEKMVKQGIAQICLTKVRFLGHVISQNGIDPEPNKIDKLITFKRPEDKKSLQRIMGLYNYLGKFIPNLAASTSNIRGILRKNVVWHWGPKQDGEFDHIKECVRNAPSLAHFYKSKMLILQCDASKDAMGAALLQEDRPLAFASASFSDSQKQYSQIEKELLSVYYGCKKFEYLLSGHTFVVQTDHQPLLPLVKKPLSDISPRLQRLVMKLIAFDFKLQYKPGKYLIVADTLSRDTHPMDELPTPFLEDKRMVKMVRVNISDEKLVAMQKDTREDPALVKVIDYVIEGWPICKKDVDEDAKVFFDFRHRLYLWNDLLCIGSAIVIPKAQRNNMLNLLHQSHQGISAIQGLARESLFWPRMSIDIAEKVKNCEICQKHQKSKIRQPLKPFPVPDYPWQTVSLDIFYIQKKPHLLVVDRYSGYPEVFTLDPPTAINVKNKLRETFARFGIPETMMSDNGPPFRSEIMTDFCIRWGIKQLFSSPHLHRSNGLAERNIQTIKNQLIKCRDEGSDPYLAILAYRNTPKNDLPSPAQLCLSRSLRCQIPRITPLYRPYQTNWRSIENAKRKRQSSMKEQYDRNSKSYPKVNVGEDAWCQIHPREAWTPVKISAQADSPQSFEVVTPSGNRLIRNQQFIRPRDGGYEKSQLSSEPITASPEAQHPQCDSPTMGESSTAPIQRSSEETNIDQREGATTSAGIAPEPSGRPRFSRPVPYDTRPVPYDTRPVPYDTRPVPYDTRPVPYDTRPVPYDTRPVPYDTRPVPYDTRPVPYDTRPVPYDTRPVPYDTRPVPYDTRPVPYDTRPVPYDTRPVPYDTRPVPYDTRPVPYDTRPVPYDTRPVPYDTRPVPYDTRPVPYDTRPVPYDTRPVPYDTRPVPYDTRPVPYDTRPVPYDTRPVPYDTRPVPYDTRPVPYDTRPVPYDTRPVPYDTRPVPYDTRPVPYDTRPVPYDTRPVPYDTRPVPYDTRPVPYDTRPVPYDTRPVPYDTRPVPYDTRPVPYDTRPVPYDTRPVPYDTRPVPYDTRPVPYDTRPVPYDTRPVPYDTRPVPYDTRPVPYDTRPVPYDTRPVPYDTRPVPYDTRPVPYDTRPVPYDTRPVPYDTRPVPYDTRPVPYDTRPVPYDTRPVPYETRPVPYDTRPVPYDTRPVPYDTRPVPYDTRPVPYDTRPVPYDTRPVPYDTRPVPYETRPVPYDTRPVPYDTRPVPYDTRPVPYDTRPVPYDTRP